MTAFDQSSTRVGRQPIALASSDFERNRRRRGPGRSCHAGGKTHFKVKKTTQFGKIITAYCTREGLSETAVKFFVDGKRIRKDQTPNDYDMVSDDQIDAMLEQQGGGR